MGRVAAGRFLAAVSATEHAGDFADALLAAEAADGSVRALPFHALLHQELMGCHRSNLRQMRHADDLPATSDDVHLFHGVAEGEDAARTAHGLEAAGGHAGI